MNAFLRPSEMDAAKRALDGLKAPLTVMPSPDVVKAALERLAPARPPAVMPMPPPQRSVASFGPGERFIEALDREAAEERRQAREAAKLEPLTFTISDQQELRVLYELAERRKSKPIPMIRRHIRGWGRTELDQHRADQRIA